MIHMLLWVALGVVKVVASPLLLLHTKPPPEPYKSPGPPPPKLALKKLYGWELYGCWLLSERDRKQREKQRETKKEYAQMKVVVKIFSFCEYPLSLMNHLSN